MCKEKPRKESFIHTTIIYLANPQKKEKVKTFISLCHKKNIENISIYYFDRNFVLPEGESPEYILVDLENKVFRSYIEALKRIRSKFPYTNISLLSLATEHNLRLSFKNKLKILNFIAYDTENWQKEIKNDLDFVLNQHYMKKNIGGN